MTEDVYGKALADMGAEPLEEYEPTSSRKRGRPPGIPNPNGGRPRKNPLGTRSKLDVRLDPDLLRLVQWHANARSNTLSESVNQLLAEALQNKEIDLEAQEVH